MPSRVASPKDRKYLESLNLKVLQKSKPKGDQDPKEYYKALQDEAKSGPLFTDKVLDTVEHLPDLPKPVSKWLGNMDDKELGKVDSRDLHLIIDWVQGSEDADLEGLSWDDAMEAQKLWHDQLHDNKEDCGEYKTHKVVFSTGGYEFVDLTTDHDLQVEGCKLKHCVGGSNYCRAVKNKYSRIISMRNSKNEPQVTIEYSVGDKSVAQCYGYRNHPPAKKLNEPLVKFFEHMGWEDGIFLLKNYTIPEAKLEMMVEHGGTGLRKKIAMNPNTPVSLLGVLAQDSDELVRRCVVSNPETPAHILETLSRDSEVIIRWNVASHTNTAGDLLTTLAAGDVGTRWRVASNPSTPASTLEQLSDDEDYRIRADVARNKSTPVSILPRLATDGHSVVRQSVASNPKTPKAVLELLSKDDHYRVRMFVVHNPSTPYDVVENLAHDADDEIRYDARQRLRGSENKVANKTASPKDRKQLLASVRGASEEDHDDLEYGEVKGWAERLHAGWKHQVESLYQAVEEADKNVRGNTGLNAFHRTIYNELMGLLQYVKLWEKDAVTNMGYASYAKLDSLKEENPIYWMKEFYKVHKEIMHQFRSGGEFYLNGAVKNLSQYVAKFTERFVNDHYRWNDAIAPEQYKVHDLTVVFSDASEPKYRYMYHNAIEEAYAILKRRGLDFLWYGKLLVATHDEVVVRIRSAAATYDYGTDSFTLLSTYGGARTIAHEFGHRFWFKFMTETDRAEFASMFGDVPAVSAYGSTDAEEDFAEVFADYVDGKDLTRDQLERFRKYIDNHKRRKASARLTFKTEVTGSHNGQTSTVMTAYDGQNLVGTLAYSEYHGGAHVEWVEAVRKGSGVATAMMEELASEYGWRNIYPGMTTDDGASLVNSLRRKHPEIGQGAQVIDHAALVAEHGGQVDEIAMYDSSTVAVDSVFTNNQTAEKYVQSLDKYQDGKHHQQTAPDGTVYVYALLPRTASTWQTYKSDRARVEYKVDGDMAEIGSVRVPRQYRNQGIARKVMLDVLASLKERGVRVVRLIASPLDRYTSPHGLISFYKSLGFRVAERANPAGDPWMVLSL